MGQSSQAFHVLGDVAVTIDGERRPVTAAKQRAALAILLLSANRTVSATALLDGVWGAALPQHPDTALQIAVSRLRVCLGPAADRLVSVPSGYRIDVAADELDLARAQSAFAEGRRICRENDPDRAADVLEGALACWTAEPLQDLVAFPFCELARHRLRELRISIYELRNDALLDAGRHLEVLETVGDWIEAEPWRERLRAQQVLALYRTGRQVDALRAYDTFRNRLVDELGVDPSPELCELHRDVLSQAPGLVIGVGSLGSRIPLWTSLVLPFVGRGDQEELIFGRIREVFAGNRMMVLVEGEAGIGKTRLILEVARRVQDDAIVLSATANDSMRPAVVGIAHELVAALLQLPDDELRCCLGRWPGDLAAVVPSLLDRLPDLVPVDIDVSGGGPRLVNAVASGLAALSRRAPIVLLLDDVHRSGASLLTLLGRMMVVDEQQRILVLATARSRLPSRSSQLDDLVEALERRGRLERVRLVGLAAVAVERLLGRLGTPVPPAKAQLLQQVTNGQPFFLGEILRYDDWERALTDPPPTVREFVRRRVHALGDAEEGLLIDAAGIQVAFDVALLAEITGLPPTTTAALIDRTVDAGVLRTVGKGTYIFVHELSRRALLDRLDAECRAQLNQRIAECLEARDMPPAVLAMHWRLVAGREGAERTFLNARLAGDAALRDFDPVAAQAWYEIALAANRQAQDA